MVRWTRIQFYFTHDQELRKENGEFYENKNLFVRPDHRILPGYHEYQDQQPREQQDGILSSKSYGTIFSEQEEEKQIY